MNKGVYYETVDAIKDTLRNAGRNSLPVGTVIGTVPFESRVTRTVINDVSYIAEIPESKPMIQSLVENGSLPAVDAPEPEPEYTRTAEDLQGISLEEIFAHVRDRVVYIPVDDENQVMSDLAILLGKASRGQKGTQLHLLMKFALFLLPKSDIEGEVIENEEPPNGGSPSESE